MLSALNTPSVQTLRSENLSREYSRQDRLCKNICLRIYFCFGMLPLEWDGGKRKVRLLGREMLFGENGLPAAISTYFDCQNLLCEQANPILKEAMRFTVQTGETTENFRVNSYHGECDDAACRVMAESESEHFTLTVSGSTEYDGYGFFDLALTAKQDIKVQDAFLSVAFTEAASKYFVGLGRQGGKFTEPLDFHWDTANHQDSFWMGNVNFGLRMQFQDENYVKPNVNIYYCYKPLRKPDSWGGEGKGGIRIDRGIARAYSGPYHAKKGETLVCIASWADGDEKVRLRNRLGRKIKKIEIPEMDGYQTAQQMQPEDELTIAKQRGRVLLVEWE